MLLAKHISLKDGPSRCQSWVYGDVFQTCMKVEEDPTMLESQVFSMWMVGHEFYLSCEMASITQS